MSKARRRALPAVAAICLVLTPVALLSPAGALPLQEDQPAGEGATTTTTLPEGDSDLGRIIPLPNSGHEPDSAGDRGGWQQVGLFFAICAVIICIGVYIWWRGRRNRNALRAEGLDRVEWARTHGGDVRRPSEPHP